MYVPDKKRHAAAATTVVEETMASKKPRLQPPPEAVTAQQEVVVAYESKSYRNKYYVTEKGTNKPRWIQLVPDSRYPSGYCYLDGERPVEIHQVVVIKD